MVKIPNRGIDAFVRAPDSGIVAVLLFGEDNGLVRERAGRLATAVGDGNLADTASVAHGLKGSLGTLSALPALEAAAALEKAGRAEDVVEVTARWAAFIDEMARLEPEIEKLTGRTLLSS